MKKIFQLLIILNSCYTIQAQVYVIKQDTVFYYDKIIEGADANSFDIINTKKLEYARDKNHVYCKGEKTNFDAKTFEIHTAYFIGDTYLLDKNDVYTYNFSTESFLPINSSAPKSYAVHNDNDNIYTDSTSIYWENSKLINSDAETLKIISHSFFYDKNNAYYEDFRLPIDVNNLELFGSTERPHDYITDGSIACSKSAGYCHSIDKKTLKYINFNYIKDSQNVIYRDRFLKADAASFRVPISSMEHFAKDNHHDFYLGDAFPYRVDKKHLVNDKTFRSYYEFVKKTLRTAFTKNQKPLDIAKEPEQNLTVLYTFPNSKNTKIKKGKYIYMNEKPQAFIDANSFIIYNNDYAKDKNYVYLIYEHDDYVTFNKIEDINTNSFSIIKDNDRYSSYCKDSKNVFHNGYKINDADPDSFKVLNNNFASDKNSLYYREDKIPNIKPIPNHLIYKIDKSDRYYNYANQILYIDVYSNIAKIVNEPILEKFKPINNNYALNNNKIIYNGDTVDTLESNDTIIKNDENHITTSRNKIYMYGKLVDINDKMRLRPYAGNNSYLTDGFKLFTNNKIEIPQASLANIHYSAPYIEYFTFKNGKALYDDYVFNVDLPSFKQFYNTDYAKDRYHVYYKGKITPYDVETFHAFSNRFSLDKNGVYYKNKRIKEADTNSFNVFYEYGFDKNNFYYRGKIIPKSQINLKK